MSGTMQNALVTEVRALSLRSAAALETARLQDEQLQGLSTRVERLEFVAIWQAGSDACPAGVTLLFHALGLERRGARTEFPRTTEQRVAIERLVRRAPWLADSVRQLGEEHEIWRNQSYAILQAADREIRAAKLAEVA